jgi:hypothetical protein
MLSWCIIDAARTDMVPHNVRCEAHRALPP